MLADIVTVTPGAILFPNEYIANNGFSTDSEKVYVYVSASKILWTLVFGFLSIHPDNGV